MTFKSTLNIMIKNKFFSKLYKMLDLFNPVIMARKIYLSFYLFSSKSVLDLSASSAFYFFLSIIPMALLIVYMLDISIAGYGKLSDYFFMLLSQINPELNKDFFEKIGLFKNEKKSVYGIIGVIGLIWSSRSVFNGLRVTLDLIFLGKTKRSFLKDNLISFVFLPLIVAICIFIFVFSIIVKNIALLFDKFGITDFIPFLAVNTYINIIIYLIVFVSAFCLYKFLPSNRPSKMESMIGALLFTLFFFILQKGIYGLITLASYYLLYGVISTLIVGLFWVYILFAMFYFFAQFVYVLDNYKELEFIYYCSYLNNESNFIEKLLFKEPIELEKYFGNFFRENEIIYNKNDDANYFYILINGKVKIIEEINGNKQEYIVDENEIFAENCALLKVSYNNTAISIEESFAIKISKEFYEKVLVLEPKIQQFILNSYLKHKETISLNNT